MVRIDHPSPYEPGLEPEVRHDGARTVVVLRGEHDLGTARTLARALAESIADSPGDVVVDLSEVEFMDAAIVAELARARDQMRARSRALVLRAPSPIALRILEICGWS